MEQLFMIMGFSLAAYSVVGNDVIQTLGTFLSSNQEKKWWVLWTYTAGILAAVLISGWFMYDGDMSYGKLGHKGLDLPDPFYWWYVLPPVVLMLVTRLGIPVSTSFLMLSVFSAAKLVESTEHSSSDVVDLILNLFASDAIIGKMLFKSVSGYIFAFLLAIVVYGATSKFLEKQFINTPIKGKDKLWTVLQWGSTGFLWTQWLIQDLANIYVFLPRQVSFIEMMMSVLLFVGLMAYIFKNKGGSIQKIVLEKINTTDIRSATIIDLLFGIVLFFFKGKVPMSTTWVFIGILAGRELAVCGILKLKSIPDIVRLIFRDLVKVFIGLVVSVILVVLIVQLHG